jgi:hypothetical protein
MLHAAFTDYYIDKSESGIKGYSARAQSKVWRVERCKKNLCNKSRFCFPCVLSSPYT